MFRALGAKGGSVIAAATAAAAGTSSASAETRVRTQPSQVAETKFKLNQQLDEGWLAVDGDEAWPLADISNEEFHDAFHEALQLVPHKTRDNLKLVTLPPASSSSSEHDSEEDDIIVLERPASSGAMEIAEQSMMPDLGAPRAETDALMRMVASCMRDPSIQRAFLQNADFTHLLASMKHGPQALAPAASVAGPFEISGVPVPEPATAMTTLEGHVAHFTRRVEHARGFPVSAEADYDAPLEDALLQFSEKLVDSVGNFLNKLAQTCRKMWMQSALAKFLGPKPAQRRRSSNGSCSEDPRVHVHLQPSEDGLVSVLLRVTAANHTEASSDGEDKAKMQPDAAEASEAPVHDMEKFLQGVIAFAAVVFAIVVFKRTGLQMARV